MITGKFWQALKRRKHLNSDDSDTKLARVLNLFDLTALGVGSTLGLGVYVLAGKVAYKLAGPAVTISFLIAVIASGLAAICYAEFAARVPKAGSAYVYTYVTVGEFLAFTIGWNLILEYIIGTSSVARGLSGYLDVLTGNHMSEYFRKLLPMNVSFLAPYPDFVAFSLIILLSILLAIGVKESSILNNIFTGINLCTVVIVVGSSVFKADINNWMIQPEDIPEVVKNNTNVDGVDGGEGGFMPYGIAGVMAGAAQCFYAFIGFDILATTGEEAINPKRNIPLSILLSLLIIFLSYFGVSTALTMMWPYYDLNTDAPFPYVYEKIGWNAVKWIVSFGAVFALSASLLGAMFPLPRILYAMASDGLLYAIFKRVEKQTQTPVYSTIVSGILAAILALLLDLEQLIEIMSLGTLMAYTIVAACILLLRYQNDDDTYFENTSPTPSQTLRQMFNSNQLRPNHLSSNIVKVCIVLFIIFTPVFSVLLHASMGSQHWLVFVGLTVSGVALLIFTLIIARQPKNQCDLTIKVPVIPLLPLISIFINLYLAKSLSYKTWIRFVIWMTIGYAIYFTYGVRQSVEGNRQKLEEFSDHEQVHGLQKATLLKKQVTDIFRCCDVNVVENNPLRILNEPKTKKNIATNHHILG